MFARDVRIWHRLWQGVFGTRYPYRVLAATVEILLEAIESLDPEAQECWNACTEREFCLAFEGKAEELYFVDFLKPELVQRIGAVGAGLSISVFPEGRYEDAGPIPSMPGEHSHGSSRAMEGA